MKYFTLLLFFNSVFCASQAQTTKIADFSRLESIFTFHPLDYPCDEWKSSCIFRIESTAAKKERPDWGDKKRYYAVRVKPEKLGYYSAVGEIQIVTNQTSVEFDSFVQCLLIYSDSTALMIYSKITKPKKKKSPK